MTEREALRLAWDALEDIGDEWGFTSQRTVPKRKEAITAIKKALAQPEQEPVAWMTINPFGDEDDIWYANPEGQLREGWTYKALYEEPPKQNPLSSIDYVPCCTDQTCSKCKAAITPPQRNPLTDEEIETYRYMIDWTAHWSYINFARAIEAAHGIKENT